MARKKSNIQGIVNDIKDADKANQAKHLEALQNIPSPVFTEGIPFEQVKHDKDFNVRDHESYSFEANRELYNSLVENGLLKRDPMSFSKQADGTYKVLAGHLRMEMMRIRRDELVKESAASGLKEPALKELPFSEVFGLVFDGLDENQEHLIMADHIMRKGLNEFELAKEVGELMARYPLTDEKAGIHFGMNKSKVQRLRMTYAMPTVLAEKRKEKANSKDIAFIKIGQKELTALYSAYTLDQQAGCKFREEGPNFNRAWEALKANPDLHKTGGQVKVDPRKEKEVTETQATSLIPLFGNKPEVLAVQAVLDWVVGGNSNLVKTVEGLVAYCDDLRARVAPATPSATPSATPKERADRRTKKNDAPRLK